MTVGEDRDTDGTEMNRTDGFGAPVSAILSTWEDIISFILYMFKVFNFRLNVYQIYTDFSNSFIDSIQSESKFQQTD